VAVKGCTSVNSANFTAAVIAVPSAFPKIGFVTDSTVNMITPLRNADH
jgi:hypothetical protein